MKGKPLRSKPDVQAAAGIADARSAAAAPTGGFVELDGETHYRIAGSHRLAPFLVSLACDTDLWMFVTSEGGLTAGRVDPEGSIFPYETVDKLHDSRHHTGPITLIRGEGADGRTGLWQPFSARAAEEGNIERNLSKNTTGNRLVFEEINRDLGLAFRYRWAGCDEFGWVRTATLKNQGPSPVRVALLDGLRNILPYGAALSLYQQSSTLVDAYKKSEVDPDTRLGIFSLTAGITDRAEAVEVLRANTVWCCGLEGFGVSLSGGAVAAFRRGQVVPAASVLNGRRGNFLLSGSLRLDPGEAATWHLLADSGRSHLQIAALRRLILAGGDPGPRIQACLAQAGENLRRNVGSADGIQLSGRPEASAHHFANVLFNNMRGGVFARNHDVPVPDLVDFIHTRNRAVAARRASFLAALPPDIPVSELLDAAENAAEAAGDPDFLRLCHEYLPLHFGRRHGDPSRPWNRFSILVRDRNGERALRYEGNWRDIFQNWEALCASFPGFLPGVVAKFVNASTVDGYNPYRITRDGIDWETVDPGNPWSNIGYWGDHQIVYLLRLLEALTRAYPGRLEGLLRKEIFSYADVPYRIRPYARILADPHRTIDFDQDLARRIDRRVADLGTDGKLLPGPDGSVYHAALLEKLLVPALAKLSNLIPGGGIWMNTQRPEWNDANNALAGNGLSVVTMCYLRRYLVFLEKLVVRASGPGIPVSLEVAAWFRRVTSLLADQEDLPAEGSAGDHRRRQALDALGEAFADYRQAVYARGFTGKAALAVEDVAGFCRTAARCLEQSIRANRRPDALYHSYNLLDTTSRDGAAAVRRLPEMLEGQVAVLSSGVVDPDEAIRILTGLFEGPLYRQDQGSFLLYPARELPGFLARNTVPAGRVRDVPLLAELMHAGDSRLLAVDAQGNVRFHPDFVRAADLALALDRLQVVPRWSAAVARDRQAVLDLYEEVFGHRCFTGRSGAMYGYEGIGCVYWHLVGKLLLAVQEIVLRAEDEARPAAVREELARLYYRIRAGLGFAKQPGQYGAFPMDPYSHTPASGGAKQPGMTGQVKEEILTRLGELGVRVAGGKVDFRPVLLRPDEFLGQPAEFRYFDREGIARTIGLPAGCLAFTFCQVPVVYQRTDQAEWIRVGFREGAQAEFPGHRLPPQLSGDLLDRRGRIIRLQVGVPDGVLCNV